MGSPSLHISAMSMRPVASADEISYHTIEVAHVALTLRRGGSRAPMPTSQPAASQLPKPAAVEHSQDVVHTPAPAPQAQALPAGGAKNLKESVLEVLRREQSR